MTGASSGIGEATALALAAHGATVALLVTRPPHTAVNELLIRPTEQSG